MLSKEFEILYQRPLEKIDKVTQPGMYFKLLFKILMDIFTKK